MLLKNKMNICYKCFKIDNQYIQCSKCYSKVCLNCIKKTHSHSVLILCFIVFTVLFVILKIYISQLDKDLMRDFNILLSSFILAGYYQRLFQNIHYLHLLF